MCHVPHTGARVRGVSRRTEARRFPPCSSRSFARLPVPLAHTQTHLAPKVALNNHFLLASRKSLREMAERLADKYEEAKEKHEDIMTR